MLAYPRREILSEAEKREMDVLKGGGQVAVEPVVDDDELKAKGKSKSGADAEDDDEYHRTAIAVRKVAGLFLCHGTAKKW